MVPASASPLGVDGYYYAVQVRSLLETGELHWSTSPLVPWLMAAVASVTDPLSAIRIVAVVGTALIALAVFGVCVELGARPMAATVAGVLAATAPSRMFLAGEFIKQGIATTFVVGALWAMLVAHRDRRWSRIALAAILCLAAMASHKLGVVLVAASVLVVVCERPRRWWWWLAGVLAAIAALRVVAPGALPGLFAGGTLLKAAVGPFDPSMAVFAGSDPARALSFDPRLAAMLAVLMLIALWRRWLTLEGAPRRIAIACAALALILAWPWWEVTDPEGLAPRLRLLAFAAAAILSGPLVSAAVARLSPVTARAALCGAAVAIAALRMTAAAPARTQVHPVMLAALSRADSLGPPDAVFIVPDRQLVFAGIWATRRDFRMSGAGVDADRRVRLLPGWTIRPGLAVVLRAAMNDPGPDLVAPIALEPRDELALVAMPEATYRALIQRASR